MKKTIKELAPKMSDAIRAMIDGLKHYDDSPSFVVRMTSFGGVIARGSGPICSGCAATCTLQKIASKDLVPGAIDMIEDRAAWLGLYQDELKTFETAIDRLRQGNSSDLASFYGLDPETTPQTHGAFFLSSGEWKSQLPYVEKYLEKLIENGL